MSLSRPSVVLVWVLDTRTSEFGDLIPALPAGSNIHVAVVAGSVALGALVGWLKLLWLRHAV